jgi:hypothetical protein
MNNAVMKYAVWFVADQTIAYVAKADGSGLATKHSEAHLFDSQEEAIRIMHPWEEEDQKHRKELGLPHLDRIYMVEEVADETEFRSREDTW